MRNATLKRRMVGQSFLEYLIVLAFGVIVLVSGPNPPIVQLAKAIRDYYTDYSFAISIASMPDCFYEKSASAAGISASISVDKCFDISDPEWPIDVSFDFD